jgi:hypothetical protein
LAVVENILGSDFVFSTPGGQEPRRRQSMARQPRDKPGRLVVEDELLADQALQLHDRLAGGQVLRTVASSWRTSGLDATARAAASSAQRKGSTSNSGSTVTKRRRVRPRLVTETRRRIGAFRHASC